MYEFDPSKPSYVKAADTGAIPPGRHGHCLVEAYNGTKMVLFGGVGKNNTALADIYILDMKTLTWTAGKSGQSFVGRACGACAVTNDMFVAWGGGIPTATSYAVIASDQTVVYNLKMGNWQSSYSPSPVSSPPPQPSPTNSDGSSSSSSSPSGALIGGIVGGLAVVGAIVGFFFYRRRRRNHQKDRIKFSVGTALPVVTTKTAPSDSPLPATAAKDSPSSAKASPSDDPFEANAKEENDNSTNRDSQATYIVEAPYTSPRSTGDFTDPRYYTTFATTQPGVHPLLPHAQDHTYQQLYNPHGRVPSVISAYGTSPSTGHPSSRMSSVPEEIPFYPEQQAVRIFQESP